MTQAWKIAPGEGAADWEVSREQGCICLGWDIGDYGDFKSEQAVLRALKKAYPDRKEGFRGGAAKSIWRFSHVIQPSDLVIASRGLSVIVGIGVVTSEYLPPTSPKNPVRNDERTWHRHARLVDWRITREVDLQDALFARPTLHLLEPKRCERIKTAYLKKYPQLRPTLEALFGGILLDSEDSLTTKVPEDTEMQLAEQAEKEVFIPTGVDDGRERILSAIVRRRGQPAFRKKLLVAYRGRCAMTGCEVEAILEAAHITPYKGAKTNRPGNGLLLRADMHTLFDLKLVAVDEKTMQILVSPKLGCTEYKKYHGRPITVPGDPANRPSTEALRQHRLQSGLGR